MRSATGLTAGPDSPPTPRASCGRRRSASMAMPRSVLMSDSASAPADTAARAISVTSVTFGVSFTMSGRFVAARHRDTTASTLSVHVPMVMPPASTFGHEMFTSYASTGASSNASITCTYSSKLWPDTFTMTVAPRSASHGRSHSFKCATPGF